ncbi:MAG: hypothetical protein PHU85_15845, partial [Phycisphaerae bacterium]|nr:hypothetical protein [Phycisphaerae bacterium]
KASHPKTEPLPAFLRRAASGVHEEPEKQKTKPLPRPAGRPSPVLATGASAPPPALANLDALESPATGPLPGGEESPRRAAGLLSPLVPIAFAAGLLIGVLCGWWIARAGSGPAEKKPTSDLSRNVEPPVVPAATPAPTETPSASTPPPQATPTPTPKPAQFEADQFAKKDWLADQPRNALAEIDGNAKTSRRVAAISDAYPCTNIYYPAPSGSVYLEVSAKLKWTNHKPATFALGGASPDCWLLCQDGRTFLPLGVPRKALDASSASPAADPDAKVALDQTNPAADVTVLFLVPSRLSQCRLAFTSSQFAELKLKKEDATGKRTVDGDWDAVPVQLFAQDYKGQKFMAALAKADKTHRLTIDKDGDNYKLTITAAGISGTLTPAKDAGYFDAAIKLGDEQATATVRMFDAGRQLLIYFGPDKFMQVAYQRYEPRLPGE